MPCHTAMFKDPLAQRGRPRRGSKADVTLICNWRCTSVSQVKTWCDTRDKKY